jgi:hypothetical protein
VGTAPSLEPQRHPRLTRGTQDKGAVQRWPRRKE